MHSVSPINVPESSLRRGHFDLPPKTPSDDEVLDRLVLLRRERTIHQLELESPAEVKTDHEK